MFRRKQIQIVVNLLIIILCALQEYVLCIELHASPVSHVNVIGNTGSWKKIDNEKYEYPTWDAVAPTASALCLHCSASYPIQWTFTGHYFPPNNVEFLPPQKIANNSKYGINVCLMFTGRDHIDWAISVLVGCEKVGSPEVDKSVLVFVRKNSHRPLLAPRKETLLDSTLIPCPTKDPYILPSLHKRTQKGLKRVTDPNIKYNFFEGFRSTSIFSCVYICRWRVMSVTVNALLSTTVENIEIIPKQHAIRVFSDDSIEFTCKSKWGEQTHLTLDDAEKKLSVNYGLDAHVATVKMSGALQIPNYFSPVKRLEGRGKCVLAVDDVQVVVKEWSYEFVNTPELYVNNFLGTFDCVSNARSMSIRVYRCNNKMECDFASHFPLNTHQCDRMGLNHISSSDKTFCILGREEYKRSCVRLQYTFNSGLVQCKVDGLVKQWEFFTSLDNQKYINWKDASETELARINQEKSISGISRFICSAVSYLFADSIYFEIEFRNGSSKLLKHNGKSVNLSDDHNLRQYQGRTYFAVLRINLPKDTAAIHCIASWWNETGEMRASKKFEFEGSEKTTIYSVIGLCGIFFICGFFLLLLVCIKKHKSVQQVLRDLTDEEVEEFFKGRPELLARKAVYNMDTADLLPFPKKYEIPLNDLKLDSEKNFLGVGNFSYVVRGIVISKGKAVAIKVSKPSAGVDIFKSILSEVKIMVYIGKHENVLSLTGVCTQSIRSRTIHIATDICELGDLKNFLMKARPTFKNIINANHEIDISLLTRLSSSLVQQRLTILDLIRFSCEIAKGMEYLATISVVHADLAARNVLLTADKVVKISDFGLSKKLYENTNYVKKSLIPLPWRWMAIESLTSFTFSTSSDVWAYGVTLFEIFSLGDTPYPNEQWNTGFLSRLEDGMRLGRPKHSTKEIYHLLSECWEKEPQLRPSFSTIRSFFEKLSGKYAPAMLSSHEDDETSFPVERRTYSTRNTLEAS